jgi:YVTN family beta-propeller protein
LAQIDQSRGFHMRLRKNVKPVLAFAAALMAGGARKFALKTAITIGTLVTALAGPAAAEPNFCPVPPADTVVTTINNVTSPTGIVVDHFRGVVYATNFTTPTVSVIDENTNAVITTIPVGTLPYALAIDTFHGKVYVVNYSSASVSVIDEGTNTVTATITGVSGAGHDIAVDPVAGRVYVVTVSGMLWVIDQESNAIINHLALPTAGGGVAVDPIRGTIYVALNGGGHTGVEVVDPNTLTVTATIPLTTNNADWMAFEPIGRKLYVTGSNPYQEPANGAVFVVDTTTNTLAKTIPTLQNTVTSIAVDPVLRTIYVANTDYASYTGGVMVIDAVTDTLKDNIPLNYVFGLALDMVHRSLYASATKTNSISVISTGAPHSWPIFSGGRFH